MMRSVVLVALVACSKPKPEPQPPPAPTTQCPKVADHLVALMGGGQKYPPEATDPFRRVIAQRCEHDRWSDQAQRCLLELSALEEGQRCQELMTQAQVEAFHRDSEAALGDLHSQMHEGSDAR